TNTYALYECSCTGFYKRETTKAWLVGTNHYCSHPKAPFSSSIEPLSTYSRYHRMETLIEGFVSRNEHAAPVQELIRILADDGVEVRNGEIATVYSNVACPNTQELWYTFGGYPAASQGNWQKLEWPW
ncbi:MAG TPA: hypothetical protein VHY08_27710, partial [Bacillota bacterium]|nr:hypothetical protein [Bacillota bacterium]